MANQKHIGNYTECAFREVQCNKLTFTMVWFLILYLISSYLIHGVVPNACYKAVILESEDCNSLYKLHTLSVSVD